MSEELTDEQTAKLAELDTALAKFESQKRWSDVIRTMLAKADIVVDPEQKVQLFREAGTMYIERSSNQAEAIKCFEKLLEIEPGDIEAITRLKEMYEKRRDWEKLIRTMEREAVLLDPADQPLRYVEMAELATERLRKPDICISLWAKVLEADEDNADALSNLANLYERARNWEPLAAVLEKLTAQSPDTKQLQKLGMIYADKIGDDAGAVRAFKRLLELEPGDRRASEQLKRRYVALKAWDELEEFYAASGKWDELIRVLEREADNKETSPEDRVDLLFQVATLWVEKKEKPDRAARAFEKILESDETNLRAAEALSPIYEAAGDARKLARVYEVRLTHDLEPSEKVALLRETGILYEESLRAPETAFEKYLDAFKLMPTTEVIREDVDRLAEQVEGWSQVVDAHSAAIEATDDIEDSIDLQISFGKVLARVGRVDEAIAQFQEVYEIQDDNPAAIAALGELYRRTERYDELMVIYDRRLELDTDPDSRRVIAYQRAALFQNDIKDANKAITAYQEILGEYGHGEGDAFRALDALYESESRWEDFAGVLERRIELSDSPEEMAAHKFRLGRAKEQHLADPVESIELYREVLTILPEHDGAREALEGLLANPTVGSSAAEILEPIYEGRGEWEKLVRALRVLHDNAADDEQRLRLLTKIGRVHGEQSDDPDAAFNAYAEALRSMPDSEDTLARLELIASEQEKFPQLVTLLGELGAAADNPDLARGLWMKSAMISDTQLDDVDGAVGAYRKVLDQDAGDVEVLSSLEMLFRRTERWSDLVGVLRRRAEQSVDPVEQEELLSQMALITDEYLESPDDAITIHREILELDPTSVRALRGLDDLLMRQERWSDLADNVDRQLELSADPDERIALMLRLASLRESKMDATESAIEIYREVLAEDPENKEGLDALERLSQNPAYQLAIAEVLEPIYQGNGEIKKLIGVHEVQAAAADSVDRKVELFHRIADLHEVALDDPGSAFQTYARALAEDPGSESTQEQLERLKRAIGGAESLAEVYEQQAATVEDPHLAANLHVKAAAIRESIGDHAGAIEHYGHVLTMDAENLEAASALERLYQLDERYDDLASICIKKSAMLHDPDEQKQHLFRAATIYEEVLERPADAVGVYHQILEIDEEDDPALSKLIELHLRAGDWESLLSTYERKADICVDPDEKKRIFLEVGAVYEQELKDNAKAIDTYQRILEIDPTDLTALGRLDVLYQGTTNADELLSVLERQADLASDPNEVISYRYRIAELHRSHDDPERAVDIFRDILDVVPEHQPTLDALETMVSGGVEPVASAGVLEPVYRQSGEWGKLISVLEVQVAHEADPIRQTEILHQVAELYEFQLEQGPQAFDAYARSLPLDNRHSHTLESLERLAEQTNSWPRVTQLYDVEIQRMSEESPDDVVDLALRAAMISEVHVGDVDGAIRRYQLVTQADPGHVQAIESLDRLYESAGRWEDLAEVLQHEIRVAASPDDILDLQFRAGQVYQEHLGNVDGAIDQYREILAAAPEHTRALTALEMLFAQGVKPLQIGEVLEPLYRLNESWGQLLNVHEVQLQHQPDPIERVSMMHRIAEIAEERANEHERAFEWMQRALLEEPSHDHTAMEVERLSNLLNGWPQLANTYADVLENGASVEDKVFVGRKLARVFEEELDDVQGAEHTFRYVIGLSPDEESLGALDRIYEQHGSHNALADILRRRIGATDDPVDQVDLHHRLGVVLEDELGETDAAIQTFQQVLGHLDPEHAPSIRALQNIYTRQENWAELYTSLNQELEVVGGDFQQGDILSKMARLASEQLGDPAKAIELWRRVLDLRGEDPEALNALGNIYASQENWADLVDVLEREVSIVDDEHMRVAVYSDLGSIWYGKLGRDRNALENWERVLDIDPMNTNALFQIAEIYRNGNQHHELVDTLHRVIDVGGETLDHPTLENTYMQLGWLYNEELKQPMDSVDAYNNALRYNPANFQAMDALETIHREEGMWESAIEVMEKRAAALPDPAQRIQQLETIAQIWESQVDNKDAGTKSFQSILEIDPQNANAFAQLESLHTDAMRWEDLIDMYVTRVEEAEDTETRVRLLGKVAKVYEDQLGEPVDAFEALQIAWMEDFSDKETATELERVAGATNKWNELLTAANQALQEVPPEDKETKIAICLHCARWYGQHLGHPEYAIPYYEQILALDPSNVAAMRQMAELYRTTQQWQTLAQVLGRLVEMTDDRDVKAETYVQMGDLSVQHLGIPQQAPQYYQKAIDVAPKNIAALEALERIYGEQGNWDKQLEILSRKVQALEENPDAGIDAQMQVAETYETRIDDPDAAINAYQKVLAEDPQHLPALRGLERLYAKTERWQPLVEVLEAEYEVVETERDRINILTRLAEMWEVQFIKPDKAADRLEQVLEIDPTHDGSLNSLARIYRNTQQWDKLIDTYERHVMATPDRGDKIRIYKELGGVYAAELDEPDRAVDAYLNVLSINEQDIGALDSLTRLYDKRGDHVSALEMMEQLATLVSEPEQQVDLKYRIGRILDEELGDRVSALDNYQMAVDLDPSHLASLEAMRKIQIDSGDWHAAARLIEQEASYTDNPRKVSELLVELGTIYRDRLDEADKSVQVFEAASKQDPDNEDAALPLADTYMAQERFGDAFPLLEMLVKRSTKREPEEQHRLAFMLGNAASEVGDDDAAIKALNRAYQIDSTHLPSLMALAGSYYRAKTWDRAFKFYQMLLVHHRDSLGRDDTVDIFYRLGVIKREQNERRKALNMFDKALEEDAHHKPTLEAVVGLYETQNQWEQVIHFKKQILEVANEEDERFELLDQIGELWKGKVGNTQRAVQAWQDASNIKPDDHVMLHKLLGAYQETKQWEPAIEIIEQVAALDGRDKLKAKYAYTVGVIIRDEMKDPDAAIAKFDEALNYNIDELKAFEAINKIFTAKKDWKGLERAYRKMLQRVIKVGDKKDLEFNLWHTLGIIYRDRQRNLDSAAEAFQMSVNVKPDEPQQHQILAELYSIMPSKVEDAIREHQWLLRRDPYRVDSYHALYKLYFDARAYDKAWCLAATLTYLKKANAEQQQFYSQYKQAGTIRPASRVDRNAWFKDLFHPKEDRYVSKIMELMAPAVHAAKQASDKALNIHRIKPVSTDPSDTSAPTFARTFGFVVQVLNIPIAPRLFLQQQTAGSLTHIVGSNPPAAIVGSTLLSGYQPQDLTYVIGRFLTYYKAEHFIRTMMTSHSELRMVLLAAMRIAGVGPADPSIDQWAAQLQPHLAPAALDGLRSVCRKFVESGGSTDIKAWMQAVELSGMRAGFLMCNELETAVRMVQALPPDFPADLPVQEKLKELVLFSVSEEYFRLRELLGITIRV